MTEQAVQIIITIKLGDESREVEQSIAIEELEGGLASLNQSMQVSLGSMIFEMLDTKIHQQRPKTWQSLGTAQRSLLTECGTIHFRRHIYWDERGKRLMPLDLLLTQAQPRSVNRPVKRSAPKWSPTSYSIPAFSGLYASQSWVQLLKRRLNDSLSINSFF